MVGVDIPAFCPVPAGHPLAADGETGVRVFDLRVRFDRGGGLVPCTGWWSSRPMCRLPQTVSKPRDCYYRVVLENRLGGHRVKADDLDRLKAMFLTPEHPALSLCKRQT